MRILQHPFTSLTEPAQPTVTPPTLRVLSPVMLSPLRRTPQDCAIPCGDICCIGNQFCRSESLCAEASDPNSFSVQTWTSTFVTTRAVTSVSSSVLQSLTATFIETTIQRAPTTAPAFSTSRTNLAGRYLWLKYIYRPGGIARVNTSPENNSLGNIIGASVAGAIIATLLVCGAIGYFWYRRRHPRVPGTTRERTDMLPELDEQAKRRLQR